MLARAVCVKPITLTLTLSLLEPLSRPKPSMQAMTAPDAMVGVEFVALGNFSALPQGVDPADVDLGVYNVGKPVAYPGARPQPQSGLGLGSGLGHRVRAVVATPRADHRSAPCVAVWIALTIGATSAWTG